MHRSTLDYHVQPGYVKKLLGSDNGIGIALADLKQLFVPFRQIDSNLTRAYEGTGLGLALVKESTDLHGKRCLEAGSAEHP